MTPSTLSQPAQDMIHAFLSLRIGDITLPCLYYNNKRIGARAGLRVSIGKGSPSEIEEEVRILAQKDKLNLQTMDEEMIRMFLQKHHLGVDCSAFAYYVLDAELRQRTGVPLRNMLKFPYATNLFRKILIKLRPVENTNVRTLAHESNSTAVSLRDVRAGDIITILEGGRDHAWYHVIIIHEVIYSGDMPKSIHYTHSYQWPSDGQYHHGVRSGMIEVRDSAAPILEQKWIEQGKEGVENVTWSNACEAGRVEVRRVRGFSL